MKIFELKLDFKFDCQARRPFCTQFTPTISLSTVSTKLYKSSKSQKVLALSFSLISVSVVYLNFNDKKACIEIGSLLNFSKQMAAMLFIVMAANLEIKVCVADFRMTVYFCYLSFIISVSENPAIISQHLLVTVPGSKGAKMSKIKCFIDVGGKIEFSASTGS